MTTPVLNAAAEQPWHALARDDVVTALDGDAERGLSSTAAERRLALVGPNSIEVERHWVRLRRLAAQFNDVLIWLLLVAAAVSGIVLGSWIDASAIAAIVVLNAVLGYVQESRADAALQRLQAMAAPDASVIRDGVTVRIDARDVVPGDVLALNAGDQIAADARVTDAIRLRLSESLLTGESFPVAKDTEPTEVDVGLGDRTSMVHAGTTAVAGRGRAIVTATGRKTEMGRIASLIEGAEPDTPLQQELARVGRRLALVAVVAAVFIFGAGVARSYPVETMFLTAVAMAVAAIPEGLPAVVTVSLAGGVQRMANRGAIVRRLPAVEALGAVDVICTDKTGTLTLNDLRVSRLALVEGEVPLDRLGEARGAASELIRVAVLCNDAVATPDGFDGDPTDVALVVGATRAGLAVDEVRGSSPRRDEAAFDSRRKRMSTLHEVSGDLVMASKGAPEVIAARASRVIVGTEQRPMDDETRASILGQAERLAAGGLRTLAFASRRLDATPADVADEEHSLVYLGMIGFRDEVRPEIEGAVRHAAGAGVRTVMVTGDHAVTATAIAGEVGIGVDGVMLGSRLRETDAATLSEHVTEHDVYARVDPVDKVKIVEAWQAAGATVAMTGDGINDAPALHVSDIGVAMGSGTDVAREASSLVLADDNYATIVAAIRDGRRIFANLRNVVHYLLSANAAELLYVAIGFLAFGALGEPLLAVQLLWINLLSDALPAIALGMDVPGRDLMKDPPGVGRNVLSARNIGMLLAQGALLAGAALLTLWAGHGLLGLEYSATRTMVFSTLVLAQLLHALNVRSADGGRLTRPRPLLIASLAGSMLLQFAVVYLSFGHVVFDTQPIPLAGWLWISVASIASFIAIRVLNRTMADRHRSALRP